MVGLGESCTLPLGLEGPKGHKGLKAGLWHVGKFVTVVPDNETNQSSGLLLELGHKDTRDRNYTDTKGTGK